MLVNYESNMIRISVSKNIAKIFRKLTKKQPWGSLVLVKLQKQSPECSVKESVLRKVFAKCTGKHLSPRLYFNKVTGLRLWYKSFPLNFCHMNLVQIM